MEPDDKRLLILAILTAIIWGVALIPISYPNAPETPNFKPQDELNDSLVLIQGNTLKAVSSPIIIRRPLRSFIDKEYPIWSDNPVVQKVIECESSGRHFGANGKLLVGDKKYRHQAFGILQMQKRTASFLAEKMGRPYLSIENAEDQIEMFLFAKENGFSRWWTCYNKIK